MRAKLLIFISASLCVLRAQTGFAATLHFDAGATSDYVWRGLTQTRGKPAVSGGMEHVTDGNWYFGGWVTNTQSEAYSYGSAELDLYVGLTGQGDSLGYDIGIINYHYLAYSGADFSEMYFALVSDKLMFKWSDSADAGTYLEINITFPLSKHKDSSMVLHVGNYDRSNASGYVDTSISLNVSELSLTLSKASVDTPQDKDLKAFVSWKHSF